MVAVRSTKEMTFNLKRLELCEGANMPRVWERIA